MDAFRKQIQSLVDFVLDHCFRTYTMLSKFLTMITRIELFWKSYLVCSDINERYDIRQASFTLVFKVFALQVISYRIF